jgi:hypothetical protein
MVHVKAGKRLGVRRRPTIRIYKKEDDVREGREAEASHDSGGR